jgi:hypothetical protein
MVLCISPSYNPSMYLTLTLYTTTYTTCRGIEERALEELNAMLRNSKQEGFLSFIKNYEGVGVGGGDGAVVKASDVGGAFADAERRVQAKGQAQEQGLEGQLTPAQQSLSELFSKGRELSADLRDILSRPQEESASDLLQVQIITYLYLLKHPSTPSL